MSVNIAEFYGTDLCLKAQLTALHCSDTDRSLDDLQSIVSYLNGLNEVEYYFQSDQSSQMNACNQRPQ